MPTIELFLDRLFSKRKESFFPKLYKTDGLSNDGGIQSTLLSLGRSIGLPLIPNENGYISFV